MQKMYVSRITADHWMAKNNLEKAAKKLSKEMERRLIPGDQLAAYKKEFKDKVGKLNQEFNRCKPLRFDIDSSYDNKRDLNVYCDGVFIMEVFEVKQQES